MTLISRPQQFTLAQAGLSSGRLNTRASTIVKPISIVIPTLNEAESLPATLASCKNAAVLEVIVADGGSSDSTAIRAHSAGAHVLQAPRGRAAQMNMGAAEARGEVLLFLHADTLLPRGFGDEIGRVLREPGTAAGAFRFRVQQTGLIYRLIERGVAFRSRCFSLPYGDQGLFLSRDVFHQVGGFPDLPIMEDFELVRRLAGIGKIRISNLAAMTSPRRWAATGPLRMTLINQIVIVGYYAGVPPFRLHAWYRRLSRDRGIPRPGPSAPE